MPVKKVAKPRPPAIPREVAAEAPAADDTTGHFVKNYMWPMLMGLAAALVTALATGLPGLIIDGLQPEDWPVIGGILLAAAVGYLGNVLTRYGGKGAPWIAPPIESAK